MNKQASRPLAFAAAITIATFGAFVAPTPASAHWSCGRAAPSDRDTTGGHHTRFPTTTIRVGSTASCATVTTSLSDLASLDYHCYAKDYNFDENGATWTYVVVVGATYLRGWIDDFYLADNGSRVRCTGDIDY